MAQAPRPDGIPGLLIEELQLVLITRTSRGWIAQVRSNGRSYLLRDGDQLFDGDVVAISKNEVIFKQVIQNPTDGKPFREVVLTV